MLSPLLRVFGRIGGLMLAGLGVVEGKKNAAALVLLVEEGMFAGTLPVTAVVDTFDISY